MTYRGLKFQNFFKPFSQCSNAKVVFKMEGGSINYFDFNLFFIALFLKKHFLQLHNFWIFAFSLLNVHLDNKRPLKKQVLFASNFCKRQDNLEILTDTYRISLSSEAYRVSQILKKINHMRIFNDTMRK